jgi:hypothetical protein
MSRAEGASLDTGKSILSTGRWAGERLLAALKEGRKISPKELRTADTLQKDEWIALDTALIEEGKIRLRGIADLIAAGLTIPVTNAMGKTIFQWERVTDMDPADVSMSGRSRSEDDRVEYDLGSLPLPITHKDFNLDLRTLSASRERGESLDDTQARIAGRLVSEKLEEMLFKGGKTFLGSTIYGLTNHPNRNTASYGTGGAWTGSKTGDQIIADVLTMKAGLEGDRMFGPYWLYVSANSSTKVEEDLKAASDKSIRQRILEVDGIQAVRVVDQMPASTVVMVQATRDVVALVDGEPLQTVQWDVEGGFFVKFKAFTIQVPLIRADAQGRSGVFHMS